MNLAQWRSIGNKFCYNDTLSRDHAHDGSSSPVGGTHTYDESRAKYSHIEVEHPFSNYSWSQYCRNKKPCIALPSASHHGGINSVIDPQSLCIKTINDASDIEKASAVLESRILLRHGYCSMHSCDVIIDYNQYHQHRTMWLSDHGKYKVGPMPPHWSKVAALKRWLPHFDAVLPIDMDPTWVDFNISVYDLLKTTSTIFTDIEGGTAIALFKRGEMTHCIVDSWWYYGTSPGCRYFKFPQNHKFQSQDLDMPWFWYALLKCTDLYRESSSYECL